jgi:hypothetical protein
VDMQRTIAQYEHSKPPAPGCVLWADERVAAWLSGCQNPPFPPPQEASIKTKFERSCPPGTPQCRAAACARIRTAYALCVSMRMCVYSASGAVGGARCGSEAALCRMFGTHRMCVCACVRFSEEMYSFIVSSYHRSLQILFCLVHCTSALQQNAGGLVNYTKFITELRTCVQYKPRLKMCVQPQQQFHAQGANSI